MSITDFGRPRATPRRGVALPLPFKRHIGVSHEEFSVAPIALAPRATSSGPWVSANDPLALPFVIRTPAVVTHLGTMNGSAAGENFDIGIYDLSWNRRVSTGAQTGSGNSTYQFIDVTDTALEAGRYYLVLVRDNVTANRQNFINTLVSAPLLQLFGCYDSTTDAYPLPDPLTDMVPAATHTRVPNCAILSRAPYA